MLSNRDHLLSCRVCELATDNRFTSNSFTVSCSSTSLAVKIKVEVGDGEPIESALRRFKREVSKSGHLMELRHRRYFENSQEKRKRKVKEGRMRRKFERIARRRMANMS